MALQSMAVAMVPDEAAGTISLTLSCRPRPKQQPIMNGHSLIAALEQEELSVRGDTTAKQPSNPLTVLCHQDTTQSR